MKDREQTLYDQDLQPKDEFKELSAVESIKKARKTQ